VPQLQKVDVCVCLPPQHGRCAGVPRRARQPPPARVRVYVCRRWAMFMGIEICRRRSLRRRLPLYALPLAPAIQRRAKASMARYTQQRERNAELRNAYTFHCGAVRREGGFKTFAVHATERRASRRAAVCYVSGTANIYDAAVWRKALSRARSWSRLLFHDKMMTPNGAARQSPRGGPPVTR